MKILVACEVFGKVRDNLIDMGHEAISVDILPGEGKWQKNHYVGDVLDYLNEGWDMMIAHPPCTAICVSGNRYYAGTREREEGIEFARKLWEADIPKICLENPISVLTSNGFPKPQYINPWQFGHGETKKTALFLKNLPPLKPTNIVDGRENRIWKMAPSKDRARLRSETYDGIARAIAQQWG